ncbi:hypothetical protein BC739_006581 [Kutzneria viridogrisea]|uniref:Uncharacterized protein n=1 Tax=Kutzneria viridogrisea TaxID=47990 RepID=A0ABR6BRF5_9PSEU|nr:hypothetical protein [Kutzneria viridogrisea]
MYIEDDNDTGHEIKVVIDGHEYTAEETESYHHDGTMDTAVVAGDDGGHINYTDTNHDGEADLAVQYDSHGTVVAQAHYDHASGKWIKDSAGHGGGTMTVDTAQGEKSVGPATADTTGSGHNDTAVVTDSHGNTWMYTDVDGDGKADYAMEIDSKGQVTISEHTGTHKWTAVEHGHLDSSGTYHKDSGTGTHKVVGASDADWGADNPLGDQASPAAVVSTDPVTGEWR